MEEDEQMAMAYDLLVIQAVNDEDVDLDDDPELAAYYRDLAEVNEAIANLYSLAPW